MAKTVDDRVVSMSFETQRFQTGVSQTLSSIDKLKNALKFGDAGKGFSEIEKAASKVSLSGASSAIDKLKSRLSFGREAATGFGEIDTASNKVKLDGASNAVENLRRKMSFPEADQAFAGIEKSSGRVTLSGLGRALDGITSKFGALEGIASVAIGNIVSKLALLGGAQIKKFTFEPLTAGLQEYETNLNSIQTVLANTKAAGTTLKDVNGALLELNEYSDKTIYNFSQMAKNIGTFTAAGVDLDTATGSIKGIANLAAVSGSSADQAATAMYQLSQAISAGRVSLQDWNSVVNAGMGGTVFQRALAQTAVGMGKIDESAVKLTGKMKNVTVNGESFRNSIMAKPGEESWLTSDVLTATLQQFTGDLSKAELKAQGFNDAQIKAIQAQAKMAVEAATKVKTLTQLIDVAKETAQSGWAQTWQLIFGDFAESRKLFTGASEAINGMIKTSSEARNSMLKDWKALGGRKALIDGIKNAFEALRAIIKPIQEGFRDVFPRKTGRELADLTKRFRDFMESLKINAITSANLRSTFKGLFAVISIGVQIVKGIFSGLQALFGELDNGKSEVSNFTGNIGDSVYAFDQWLKSGNKIGEFFKDLGRILAAPLKVIKNLTGHINDLFNSGGDVGGLSSQAGALDKAFTPLGKSVEIASDAFNGFFGILKKVADFMKPAVQEIADTFGNIGNSIAEAIASNNFENVFSVIQTGLVAGIFLTIKRAIGGGLNLELGTGGALAGISKSLNTLNGSLKAIQNNIKANTMLQIAAAVALLAAATVALSMINPKKLTTAMAALTASMGQLMASLFIMDKVGGKSGFLKAPVIAASLIGIATALNILVLAVVALSLLKPEKLAVGLAGITGMLAALSLAIKPLSMAGPGLAIAAPSLIALGIALNILAGAVIIFSTMSWGELLKGLAGVALVIDVLGLSAHALSKVGPSMIIAGAGLTAMGIALTVLAGAVRIFGLMDWETIGKGLAGIAGTLLAIGVAMGLMPPTLPLIGAGLILVGIGMAALAGTIALLGNMDVSTLAKGIIAMGAALLVLSVGLTGMIAALPGAVALGVVAAGLAVLVPLIGILGNMDIKTIAKGIGFMVISIAALAVAGTVAAPGLVVLGAALVILGAGIVLVGTGLYLMTAALVKLAGPGAKGIATTLAAFTAFIAILPKVIINFIKGLVEILEAIAKLAPQMAVSIAKIIHAMLGVVIKESPRFAEAMIALISAFLKVAEKQAPALIKGGAKILIAFLKGVDKNIVKVTKTVISIVTKFINTVASKAGQLVTAGANLLVNFLKGIANNIHRVVGAVGDIIAGFLRGIANNISKITKAGVNVITKWLGAIADAGPKILRAGTNIIVKLVKGIGDSAAKVVRAGVTMATKFMNSLAREIPRLVDNVATAIITMLNRLAPIVRRRTPEFIEALFNIGLAIVEGIIDGMADLPGRLLDKVEEGIKSLPKKTIKKILSKIAAGGMSDDLANQLINKTDFTSTVKGLLRNIERSSLRQFISFGEENLRTIKDLSENIGKTINDGLLTGFEISQPDPVWAAMTDVVQQVAGTQDQIEQSTRENVLKIKELNADLKKDYRDLRAARKKKDSEGAQSALNNIKQHRSEIKQARDTIDINNKLIAVLSNLNNVKTGVLYDPAIKKHVGELLGWRNEVDRLNGVLETQIQKLDELKSSRQSLFEQKLEDFGTLPGIVTEDENGNPIDIATQVQNYITSLSNADEVVGTFRTTLDSLATMGLNQSTYQQLLDIGPAAQGFASELERLGPNAIAAINAADSDLKSAANTLAEHAASYMYDASIKTWEGFVAGTKASIKSATDEAVKLVDIIIKAVKKKLKIKSPSQVFAEIGAYSVEGMAQGLSNSSGLVTDAIYGVSDDAKDAIKRSMRGISDLVASEINTDPTITPVLDLSRIQAGARQIGSILPTTAAMSLASGISVPGRGEDLSETGQATPIQFNQYNSSPESLSSIDIYRQTKNQLSQAKRVLA